MKKIFIPFAMLVFLCFSTVAYASEAQVQPGSEVSADEIEVIEMGEGYTRTIYGDIIIDDIVNVAEDYRKIITYSGDDVSEFHEQLSSGMAALLVNGRVVELYNLEDIRNNAERSWSRPNSDVIVFGAAITLVAGLVGLGIWTTFRKSR